MIEQWFHTNINIDLLKLFCHICALLHFFLFTNINIAIRQVFAKESSLFLSDICSLRPLKFGDKCRLKPVRPLSGQIWPKRTKTAQNTVFPQIIAGAIFFFASKGSDHLREAIISNIAHWKSYPKYFVLLSNKLNVGFFECCKFGSLIVIFRA